MVKVSHEQQLLHWANAHLLVVLVQPSSAAAEHLMPYKPFSQQYSGLVDYTCIYNVIIYVAFCFCFCKIDVLTYFYVTRNT